MVEVTEYLASTGESIVDPLVVIWNDFINLIPGLFAAILIMIVGYFLGILLESIVSKALRKVGLDEMMDKYNLSNAIKSHTMSTLAGKIMFWYIIVIFLRSAVAKVDISGLSDLLNQFANWLPNLVAAFVIFIVGLILGQILHNKVLENTDSKKDNVKPIARLVKGIVIFFVTLIAIGQLGIRVLLVEQTWLIMVGSIALAVAIGFGLALANALKTPMSKLIKRFEKL